VTFHASNRTFAALVWAAALGCGLATPARSGASAPSVPPPSAPAPAETLGTTAETLAPDRIRLARAAAERRAGNPRGVIENLEPIDFAADTLFDEADRAAFLLGQAYLENGARDRFLSLARTVARWNRPSPYTRWIEYRRGALESEAPDSAASIADLAASPLAPYVAGVVLPVAGAGGDEVLSALATADTSTAAGRDLAGFARIAAATRAIERGEDPRPLLESVPAGSRAASRARHMLGLLAIESGDAEGGRAILEALLAADSAYAGRREVLLVLGGQSLERGDWEQAIRAPPPGNGRVARFAVERVGGGRGAGRVAPRRRSRGFARRADGGRVGGSRRASRARGAEAGRTRGRVRGPARSSASAGRDARGLGLVARARRGAARGRSGPVGAR
jgi:hypothetical protein